MRLFHRAALAALLLAAVSSGCVGVLMDHGDDPDGRFDGGTGPDAAALLDGSKRLDAAAGLDASTHHGDGGRPGPDGGAPDARARADSASAARDGCSPRTCAEAGASCGAVSDGCGGTLSCGGCAAPQTCGGAGTPNQCGCAPRSCAPSECGTVPDGCGGTLSCGGCTAPQTCGGGGTANRCGCSPRSCTASQCGTVSDGCGGTTSCGGCAAPRICSSNRCELPFADTGRSQLNYIAVPHPDDEFEGWSLIEHSPGNYNVFIHFTRGERTQFCTGDFTGYDRGTGEALPGGYSDYTSRPCRQLRMQSTLYFYEAMAAVDPYLGPFPSTGVDRRGAALPSGAPGASCSVTSDRYRIYTGRNMAIVFFDLGDGNLSRCEVEWAISQVRALRGTDWLPSLPEWSIVGASFYNSSYSNCISYTHPDHRAVHEALWGTDFGTRGPQYGRTCRSDPDTGRVDYVDQYSQAMGVSSGGTRTGAFQIHYGWLYPGYWPHGAHDDVSVFSQNQAFWIRH